MIEERAGEEEEEEEEEGMPSVSKCYFRHQRDSSIHHTHCEYEIGRRSSLVGLSLR